MKRQCLLWAVVFMGMIVLAAFGAEVKTLPSERGGQDLVGKGMPQVEFARWVNTPENKPLDTSGSVVLYRWWTNSCPFCAATLPAVEGLRKKYEERGLKVVAVYHPKPPRAAADEELKAAAARLGYSGAVALDEDWSQLKKVWLSSGRRSATSVSFLVDKKGVIRFVHPGTEYFPSEKPEEKEQDEDYRMLVAAIEAVLAE